MMRLIRSIRDWTRDQFLTIVALAFLALFAGVWTFIGVKLMTFTASAERPTVEFTTAIATTAGFLATTVATVTAAVLGIEVQKLKQGSNDPLASVTKQAMGSSSMLWFGSLTYLGVGIFVLVVWLVRSEQAADMVETFALGLLGWIAGGFTSLLRTTTS